MIERELLAFKKSLLPFHPRDNQKIRENQGAICVDRKQEKKSI